MSLQDYIYHETEKGVLYCGDCLDVLKQMPDCSVDSIVTDPPYELGFMGKHWDNTGIAYSVEMWTECLRVLKPGGHLLSFGGSRTYHRMACAIEDAGFEIRDMVEWVYGSGFPKSLNIGKAIDKMQGAVGNTVNQKLYPDIRSNNYSNSQGKTIICGGDYLANNVWGGWGTALKPAHEPVCLARKPLSENTVAENVLKHHTGALNIDGCRIPVKGEHLPTGSAKRVFRNNSFNDRKEYGDNKTTDVNGRFPANLIHDGSDEVAECFPDSKSSIFKSASTTGKRDNTYNQAEFDYSGGGYVDSGSASRFFYCAKSSKGERDAGLEGFQVISKGMMDDDNYQWRDDVPNGRSTNKPMARNYHPTVKPISLMRYLCRLITPPDGTVLDPFMGSGTTGCACALEGFRFIGIERESEYAEISKARITYWQNQNNDTDQQEIEI